jgi:hypothetical protein
MPKSAANPLKGFTVKEQIAVCEAGLLMAYNHFSTMIDIALEGNRITMAEHIERKNAVLDFASRLIVHLRMIKSVTEMPPFLEISKKIVDMSNDFVGTEDPVIWKKLMVNL